MKISGKGLGATLILSLAMSTIATAGFAKNSPRGHSNTRLQAIHECSAVEQKYLDYLWGVQKMQIYRSCMAQHGQPE